MTARSFAVLDIETTSRPHDELAALSHLWEFGSRESRDGFIEKAALHAYTGTLAVVGWLAPEIGDAGKEEPWPDRLRQDFVDADHDEATVIALTLERAEWMVRHHIPIVTFGGRTFDFQFLRHRAWALRLDTNDNLYEQWHDKQYLKDQVVDLAAIYAGGTNDKIKLHNLALMLGFNPGPTTGKNFVELWEAGQIPEAAAHNERHLYLIRAIAPIMCPQFRGDDTDAPRLTLVPQPSDEAAADGDKE